MYTAGTVYKPSVLPILDYCDTVCNATAAGVLSLKVAEAHSMYRDAFGQQRKSAKVLRLRNLGKKTREP